MPKILRVPRPGGSLGTGKRGTVPKSSFKSSPVPFKGFFVVIFTTTHAWLSQNWRRKGLRVCHVKPDLISRSHPLKASFTEVLRSHVRHRGKQPFLLLSFFFLFLILRCRSISLLHRSWLFLILVKSHFYS